MCLVISDQFIYTLLESIIHLRKLPWLDKSSVPPTYSHNVKLTHVSVSQLALVGTNINYTLENEVYSIAKIIMKNIAKLIQT